MTQQTNLLALPYIQESQAQKHITHNEALRTLDIMVQLSVLGIAEAPPAAPTEGMRWLVAPAPTGDWSDEADRVAVFDGGAWTYLTPNTGWIAWNEAEATLLVWDGTVWGPVVSEGGGGTLDRVEQLGVGTDADAVNRLAVASASTLLTHEGDDHRVTVNKATAGDTASLLFQTGWSGRAEMGTAGSDGFEVKVSEDGATWHTGLEIAPGTGRVSFPSGARTPQRTAVGGRWNCEANGSWYTTSPALGAAGETHSERVGNGAEPNVDWTHWGMRLPAGARIDKVEGLLRANNAEIGGIDLRVLCHHAPMSGPWDGSAPQDSVDLVRLDGWTLGLGWRGLDMSPGVTLPNDGMLIVAMRPTGTVSSRRYVIGQIEVVWTPA